MNQEEFFERYGKYQVSAAYFECGADFTVEGLYQAIKQRLMAELVSVRPTGELRDADQPNGKQS